MDEKGVEPTEGLKNTLHQDEEIEWIVEPHKFAMFLSDFVKAPFAMLLGIFIAPFAGGAAFLLTESQDTAIIGAVVGLVFPAVYAALASFLVFVKDIQYAGTNERIIEYNRLLSESYNSILLEDIRDSEFRRGLIDRFFDIGTVVIDTNVHSETGVLTYVRDPSELVRKINSLADGRSMSQDEREV